MTKHESSPTNSIMLKYLRLCHERHVPANLSLQWEVEFSENYPRSEHTRYFTQRIQEIERDWPFIPMEQYLASIEESKDWEDLLRHRSVYWNDVPSMLADAVKTRSLHTVRQLALHCLFANQTLREEMLALAPDQRTRKALFYPPRLKPEEHYKQYPFCIKENSIVGIYHRHISHNHLEIVQFPSDVQPVLLNSLMSKSKYKDENQLVSALNYNFPWMLEYRIFTLGYHLEGEHLIQKNIPECWITDDSMSDTDIPDAELIQMGISGILAETIQSGRKYKFDGINNRFGITGYWYLPEWP
ncbi:MAG: hypothetical protein IJA83_08960 [Clostridia bacterium]|nr:hypothetical protein [Clostridia bacterium]